MRSRGCGKLNPAALAPAVPALEGAAGVDLCDRDAVFHRYSQALEAGEEAVTTGLAVALFVGGADLPVVLDDLIGGRFRELRSRCNHPSRECTTLHRALAHSVTAVSRLQDLTCEGADRRAASAGAASAGAASAGAGSNRPAAACRTVALADVGYEVDALSVHLAAAIAAAAGCAVTNLGAGVPPAVLGGTADRLRPDYLWVSANGGPQADAKFVAAALAEAAACEAHGGALLISGDAIPPDAPGQRVDSLRDLADLLA